jgi:hypothetical protein
VHDEGKAYTTLFQRQVRTDELDGQVLVGIGVPLSLHKGLHLLELVELSAGAGLRQEFFNVLKQLQSI